MALTDLPRLAELLPGFEALLQQLETPQGECALIEGLAGPAKGFLLARLYARLEQPLLVITYQQEQAQRLWDDLVRFGVPEARVCALPSSQSLFLEGDITDFRLVGERIGALTTLASDTPAIVLGTIEAVLQRTSPPEDLVPYVFTLEAGQSIALDEVAARLVAMGYEPASTVTRPGEFSRRGGILDVFPSTAGAPVRIELFGDEIETIRPFDVATQRSAGRQAWVDIAPARELRLSPARIPPALADIRAALEARKAAFARANDRDAYQRLIERADADLERLAQGAYFDGLEQYFPYLVPESVCALDYLPAQGVVILDEPHQVVDHWERITADIQSARERRWERGEALDVELNTCPFATVAKQLQTRPALVLSLLGRKLEGFSIGPRLAVSSAPMESYRGRLPALADEIGVWLTNSCRVLLASDQPHRVREICAELRLPVKPREASFLGGPGLYVQEGRLRAGFK
ncbi:MAG TPA: hypothetical protein VKT32_07645, partial [Chthonomonadaceae bacterium]|nr:hypothetical protein [Chthonomonadaceae bacterium]